MGCSCSKGAFSRAAVSPSPADAEPSPPPSAGPTGLPRAATRRRGSVSAESGIARTLQQLPSMGGAQGGAAANAAKAEATRERLRQVVASTLLFKGLDEEQRACVVDAMFERRVAAGEAVIREGEEGDNFYVIEEGSFEASRGGARVASYDGQGAFGELALMYNCPRAATVTALTDGALWAVDRATFRALVVHSMAERQQRYEASLRGMPIFRHLGQEQLAAIADCLGTEEFQAGEAILREGEALDEAAKFFILEAGQVDCFRAFEGEKRAVGRLGPGAVFGEVALLTKAPRQADCVAATHVKCLTMGRDAFERVMGPVEQVLAAQIAQYAASNAQYAASAGGSSASASPTAASATAAAGAGAEAKPTGSPCSPGKLTTSAAALLPGSPRPSPSLSSDSGPASLGRRRSGRSARSSAGSEAGEGHLGSAAHGGGSPAAPALAPGGDAQPAAAAAQEGEEEEEVVHLPPIAEEPSDGAAAATPRAAKPGGGSASKPAAPVKAPAGRAGAGKAPSAGKQVAGSKKGGAAGAAGKRGKA